MWLDDGVGIFWWVCILAIWVINGGNDGGIKKRINEDYSDGGIYWSTFLGKL